MARALLTVLLGVATGGYLAAEENVVLTDGARVIKAKTFAPTVGDALARLGVRLGPGDRVVPSPSSALPRRIEVRRARPVKLQVNGRQVQRRLTGPTVGDILKEAGVEARGAFVYPPVGAGVRPLGSVVVAQPARVVVEHDGKAEEVRLSALTVGSLLRQMGVALGPHDRVEPSIAAYPADGSKITVVRVSEGVERRYTKIPFKRVTERTDKLEFGIVKNGTEGAEGIRVRTYKVTYEDGRAKKRVLEKNEIARPPRNEVTLVGTRRPSFFGGGRTETGKATWYNFPGLGAAHKSIPKGTVVRVTNLANGRRVDVVIRDRGPYGPGRIIDLSDTAFKELAPMGRGVIDVKLEW